MIFRSRYDTWLRIVFAITNLILLGAVAILLWHHDTTSIIVAAFAILILAGVLWMQLATYYRVGDDTLFVRCGPFHWTIPIASITSATPSDDPTSGPALSLRRVRVEYAKGGRTDELLISPEDRDGFLDALHSRKSWSGSPVPPPA
jgi:hypothetical protein